MTTPKIIGLSASLRNARSKAGSGVLVDEIEHVSTREELDLYIESQASIHLDQFIKAGRAESKPFDELYRNLQKMGGTRGLSNSEVCLVAALWGVRQMGADIAHISLADHFPADGTEVDLDELKQQILAADGVILSTPVYFGDRSSLSQRFIEMCRGDDAFRKALQGKLYAGLSVGAKRNGGQETTLIYQMMDMLQLGLLGLGNDSDTTSQYGGTAHAGDIGTIPKDEYGINTCIGTGRRIGKVALMMRSGQAYDLNDRPMIGLWELQDQNGKLQELLQPFLDGIAGMANIVPKDLTKYDVRPCIACDICPIEVGADETYRCIIKKKTDGMTQVHGQLLEPDIIMPAVYSTKDRRGLHSIYQQFMERTRYLRRGDYVFTDRLVAPVVVAELGAHEYMDIRLMTSFIRHHTVMFRPIVVWVKDGEVLNAEDVRADFDDMVARGRDVLTARLAAATREDERTAYNPVGYVLSQTKDKEPKTIEARREAMKARRQHVLDMCEKRLSVRRS